MADTKTSNKETDLVTLITDVKEKRETVKNNCKDRIFRKDKSLECIKAKNNLKQAENDLKEAKENHLKNKLKEENVPEGRLNKHPRQGAGPLQGRHYKLKF